MRSTFVHCVAASLGWAILTSAALAQQNNQPTSKVDQRVRLTTDRVALPTDRVRLTTDRVRLTTDRVRLTTDRVWPPSNNVIINPATVWTPAPTVVYQPPYVGPLTPWMPVSPWAPMPAWGPVSPWWQPVYPLGVNGMYPFGPLGGFNSINYWGGLGGGGFTGPGLPGTMPFGTGFGVY
jgi:hypothetical protein